MELETQPGARPHKKRRATRGSYSYQKCYFCRRDKQKCEPPTRRWPEECTRCQIKGFECTENQQTENRTRRGTANNVPLVQQQSPVVPAHDGEPSALTAKGLNLDGTDEIFLALRIFDFWAQFLADIDATFTNSHFSLPQHITIECLNDKVKDLIPRSREEAVRENDIELFVRLHTVTLRDGRIEDDMSTLLDILREKIESDPLEPFVKDAIESLRKRHWYHYAIQLQKDLVRKLAFQFSTESKELAGAVSKYADLIREVTDLSTRVFDRHIRNDGSRGSDDMELIRATLRKPPFVHGCLFLCGPGSPTAPQTLLQIVSTLDSKDFLIGPDILGSTLLHYACGSYNSDAVETLISLKVPVNAKDCDGSTALHCVVDEEELEHNCRRRHDLFSKEESQLAQRKCLAALLKARDLDVGIVDNFGWTALRYASLAEDPQLFYQIDSSPQGVLANPRRVAKLKIREEIYAELPSSHA